MINKLGLLLFQKITINSETLPFSVFEFIFHFLLPAAVVLFIYRIIIVLIRKSLLKTALNDEIRNRIIRYVKICLRIVLVLSFLTIIDRILGAEVARYIKYIIAVINEPFFAAGNTAVSVLTIIMMIPVFYIAAWAGKITFKMLDTNIPDAITIDDTRMFTFANLVKYVVTVFSLLIGLSIIGIDISSIAVMFGVLGIGLGFGLQNLIANLFAGIVIIITHPIKKGDLITIEQHRGYVVKVNTISTIVDTLMNETIIVPNSLLISNVIFNDSYHDKTIVIANNVSVAYDTDVEAVKEMLIEIGKRNPYFREETQPDARLLGFGASGIDMVLYSTITDVGDRGRAVSWINFEIWREFRKNRIEIPYQKIDLHIKENKPQII